jgi:Peptidase_C39 like family
LLCTHAVPLGTILSSLLLSAQTFALAPVISQRYPEGRAPGYHGESRCGPASMAMVARGFHLRARWSDAALIESLDRLDDGQVNRATAPEGIVRMAAALRLRAIVYRGFDAAWVRRALRQGGLVVALGRPRYLPQTEAHTGGHYVTIVGVATNGEFIVNDPYRATVRRGRRYRVANQTLAAFVRHKPNGRLFAIQRPRRCAMRAPAAAQPESKARPGSSRSTTRGA